jgi:hypothetical protein
MEGFITKPAHLPQLRDALQRYGRGATMTTAEEPPAAVPASTAASASLLDMATVGDVMQTLTQPKYAKLLGRFFEQRKETVAALRQAVSDASHAELRSRAHSLKGASASLGLRAVSALAQQLQVSAPDPRPADHARLLDRLEEVFELSRVECQSAGLLDGFTPPEALAPA